MSACPASRTNLKVQIEARNVSNNFLGALFERGRGQFWQFGLPSARAGPYRACGGAPQMSFRSRSHRSSPEQLDGGHRSEPRSTAPVTSDTLAVKFPLDKDCTLAYLQNFHWHGGGNPSLVCVRGEIRRGVLSTSVVPSKPSRRSADDMSAAVFSGFGSPPMAHDVGVRTVAHHEDPRGHPPVHPSAPRAQRTPEWPRRETEPYSAVPRAVSSSASA